MHPITFSLKLLFARNLFVNGCQQSVTGAGLYHRARELWHFGHFEQDGSVGSRCGPYRLWFV